ncbi:MAG: GyrI-like domain-containing protein [Candidatus Methanogranum gryphiswaldense]|nr:MAG: GyrI-like domain-containing protein [Candidatus Methanogranum sp. U3.2.1]
MTFDYKKEYKEFYMPRNRPEIIDIPSMNFISVRGKGDPNIEGGDYEKAIGMLYSVAFTIKMSRKAGHEMKGFFDYVVPPLEGLWWMDDIVGVGYLRKEEFNWISMIRLPDFVKREDFEWALEEVTRKKRSDHSQVQFITYNEGPCVQCMHLGPYDDEPATIKMMDQYAGSNGYDVDITKERRHHEIYLSDARKCDPSKMRTVIRHPVKKF